MTKVFVHNGRFGTFYTRGDEIASALTQNMQVSSRYLEIELNYHSIQYEYSTIRADSTTKYTYTLS